MAKQNVLEHQLRSRAVCFVRDAGLIVVGPPPVFLSVVPCKMDVQLFLLLACCRTCCFAFTAIHRVLKSVNYALLHARVSMQHGLRSSSRHACTRTHVANHSIIVVNIDHHLHNAVTATDCCLLESRVASAPELRSAESSSGATL